MKRNNAAIFLLFLGGLTQKSIVADSKKCCSSSCSISKNTWLPRSFVSYQYHELMAQKKRMQERHQQEDVNNVLLQFQSQDDFSTSGNNSFNHHGHQDLLQPGKQENKEVSSDDTITKLQQTTLEKKQDSDDQDSDYPDSGYPDSGYPDSNNLDFEIFDKEKDYVFASPLKSKNTASSLAAFAKRVKQKARQMYSYLKSDNKKSTQISQPQQQTHDSLLKSHKQDYVDMQKLAEDMREDLEETKENVRKQLFYENKCRTASKYNAVCCSFLMEYMQNFGGKCGHHCKNLGSMPFWSGTNQMTVGTNDGRSDLDAYQLGMGNIPVNDDGIGGVIQLNPSLQYAGADLFFQWTHKPDEPCLYFKVHMPFGAMIITPNFKELVRAITDESIDFTQITANPGSTEITYQFPRYPTPFFRPQSVSDAFFGGSCSKKQLSGNMAHPISLRKGRIAVDKLSEFRFGDITLALGYNLVNNDCGYFGVAFKASFPTGNVPFGDYMLEPIVGRAGLWGVGADVSAFYNLWSSECSAKSFNVLLQGELLHLMNGKSPNFRSFDLKQNGPGSKYLIIQKYVAAYNHVTPGSITKESMESCIIQPAVNITTLPVISNIGVEGAVAVMFDFCNNNWNFDLGGEFWGRSAECLQIDTRAAVAFRLPNLNDFAVLGRQLSSYLIDGQPNIVNTFYSEPLARINKSQDPVVLIGTPPNVTKPLYVNLPDGIVDARIASNRIPVNLNEALDICGAQASSVFTGKIFGQASYTWVHHCYQPSLGIVGGVEFTDNTNNMVQLWSIGIHGSVQF